MLEIIKTAFGLVKRGFRMTQQFFGFPISSPLFASQHIPVSVGGTLIEVVLFQKTLPAGTLGPNGSLLVDVIAALTNSANAKTIKVKFGGNIIGSGGPTTAAAGRSQFAIRNRNNVVQQSIFNPGLQSFGSSVNNTAQIAVDTNADQVLQVTGQTTLETGFVATSCTRAANVVTVNKSAHGLNTGEYVKISGATPASFNADPVPVTVIDVNNFTYANAGANEVTTVQPAVQRYSVLTLESVDVEVKK